MIRFTDDPSSGTSNASLNWSLQESLAKSGARTDEKSNRFTISSTFAFRPKSQHTVMLAVTAARFVRDMMSVTNLAPPEAEKSTT